ncbi:PREDICTED: zinc finger protein 862-like [Priapulus caudatus]|uniref:Zinc finger protein 862-like n=1 Tax=Priapulus caudatus TaxID=37621 RepID=A0ABM1EH45_PRICU|nr:PREDICTED: zinc finger protein 862-like [Priapulus caudatus]
MSWEDINNRLGERCPNILQVIDLVLSLPAGSSECERGFSHMKATKSQYRNRMRSTTMTMLLTIKMHSAEIQKYDPSSAIHHWNQNHHRRPKFLEKKRHNPNRDLGQVSAEVEDEVEAEEEAESDFSDIEYIGPGEDA